MVSSGASEPPTAEQLVAAHYDRAARTVSLHTLGPASGAERWSAHPDLHCVAAHTDVLTGCALDLATGGRFPAPSASASALVSRARLAWDRAPKRAAPFELPIVPMPPGDIATPGVPFLVRLNSDALYLRHSPSGSWNPLTPLGDGKPLLAGTEIHRAQLAGDVLALAYGNAGGRRLLLLRGPDGAVLGEVEHSTRRAFTLSADGRWLARRDMSRAVAVAETAAPARTVATAAYAGLHDALALELAHPFCLTVVVGGHRHTFRLADGELKYKSRWELIDLPNGTKGTDYHTPTGYDFARFPPRETVHAAGWRAVVDRLGQVLLFRGSEGPLVAAFVVRRELVAAWIPGGVFWGDPRLIGGPATPDAGPKIGRAIAAGGE